MTMLSRTAATAFAAVVLCAPAMAQDADPNAANKAAGASDTAKKDAADKAAVSKFTTFENVMVKPFNVTVDDLEDMDLYNAEGESIGDVEDVLIGPDGRVAAISADIGGFLGIGEAEVLIELSQISMNGDKLTIDMTEEEAEQLPRWREDD